MADDDIKLNFLPPGASQTVAKKKGVKVKGLGSHALTCVVNPNQNTYELGYGNNFSTAYFQVVK